MLRNTRKKMRKAREKIESKNGLENYCFSMRNTINDPNVGGKIDAADKEKMEAAIKKAIEWLEANQLAEKEEFEGKQKEVEAICSPIITKMYQAGGGAPGGMPDMSGMGGMPGGMPGGFPGAGGAAKKGGASDPKIEEVD